jgi:acyl carrier protein
MTIGRLTPLATLLKECFSINDLRTLVAKQPGVDIGSVTSETHFTNDLGADLFDRVELMLAIEDQFVGVEITDDETARRYRRTQLHNLRHWKLICEQKPPIPMPS